MNDGVDCEYAVEGNGPPIIFVHGIGASRHAWDAIIPYLRERYTCISYDLRGHGVSPVPPPPYTLDQMVADLNRLQTKLNIERAHVIGHSLGGMIGPAYARRCPDRVHALGLLSTAAARSVDDRAKVEAVVASMEAHGISDQLPALVSRWFTDAFIEQNPSVVECRLKQVLATDQKCRAPPWKRPRPLPWRDPRHSARQRCLKGPECVPGRASGEHRRDQSCRRANGQSRVPALCSVGSAGD